MRDVFQPLGGGSLDNLLVGSVDKVVSGLGSLVGWFDNPRDRADYAVPLVRHLVDLLGQVAPTWAGSIEHLHFAYQVVMETTYKMRAEPGWVDLTVWAALSQVAIGPQVAAAMRADYGEVPLPGHAGFERLVILADKAGNDQEVLRLCAEAQAQGWAGSWDERRAKAHRRLGA